MSKHTSQSRRSFIGALSALVIAPSVPHRVYSFLWDNPLVQPVYLHTTRYDSKMLEFAIVYGYIGSRLEMDELVVDARDLDKVKQKLEAQTMVSSKKFDSISRLEIKLMGQRLAIDEIPIRLEIRR